LTASSRASERSHAIFAIEQDLDLTPEQHARLDAVRLTLEGDPDLQPDEWDADQVMPEEARRRVADAGFLGAGLSARWGGQELDPLSLGLLHQEVGRFCSSLRSLLTVHGMVASVIDRWGTDSIQRRVLPGAAKGELILAFALTEDGVGSDGASVTTRLEKAAAGYRLTGAKRWVTFGEWADHVLVVARSAEGPTAVLVARGSPGVEVRSVRDLLGVRASMTADLAFHDVSVPEENVMGRAGFGFEWVAQSALELGRFSVAWGSLGLAYAGLESMVRHARERVQFGRALAEHQLVQRIISRSIVDVKAAASLCRRAADLRQRRHVDAIVSTAIAKYAAARCAARVSQEAVQIHGARGCGPGSVQRLLRDSRIMEIIEGTSQMHEISIANHYTKRPAPRRQSAVASPMPRSTS